MRFPPLSVSTAAFLLAAGLLILPASASASSLAGLPAATLSVTCTPQTTPVSVPAAGASYSYDIEVTNNGGSATSFDIWAVVTGPGVTITRQPSNSRTLEAGESLSNTLTLRIPASAAPNEYTHTCNVGSFPMADNSDSFTFVKQTPLVVTCTPQDAPISIPNGGGDYYFDIAVTNTDATPITFDIWVTVTGPGVSITRPPSSTRTLDPGESLSHTLRQNVPAGIDPNEYTHSCNVGDFSTADASDSFTWTLEAPAAQATAALAHVQGELSDGFELQSTYPNPFNPTATFSFSVTEQQPVRAEMVNLLGRVVATLFDGTVSAGEITTVRIDGADLPSGTYVVRLFGETFSDVHTVTLLK